MKYLYTISLCLVFIFLVNVNITNSQGSNAQLSKTQCPATCPRGQQCIKKADDFLDCRETATNCSPTCTGNKVCVKATPTAATGICVDDAPASAKTQSLPAGSVTTPAEAATSTNPTGLLDGLNSFRDSGSGLNTTGTLIGYVANIIRWILSILGTVFFMIIVIQGYLYMIAGGDASKTAAATGAITNAIVGLMIIMGAFLITNFVTSGVIDSGGGTSTTGTEQQNQPNNNRNNNNGRR
jgi:hypothetical protein